jgi:hypothetical protein
MEWDEPIPASRDTVVGEFRDRSLAGTMFAPDAAQNFIVGWGFNLAHSNAGGASFIRKDRTGTVTGAWTVNTPDDQKPDDMGGGQTGADLAVIVLTHEPISTDTRRNRVYLGLLQDVLVPYPAGQPALGGFVPRDALLGGGDPTPVPTPTGLTKDDVREAVTEALMLAMGTTQANQLFARFQKAAENGAEQALTGFHPGLTAAELPAAMLAVLRDDAFFAQFLSMLGQSSAKVLVELAVADPAQAPAWVRGLPGFPWRGG